MVEIDVFKINDADDDVSSRLDYCNTTVIVYCNESVLNKPESVLPATVRKVLNKQKFDSFSANIHDKLEMEFARAPS